MNTRILLLFTIIFFGLSAFSQQNDLTIINKYLENNIENYSFKTNDINDIIINDIVDSESKFTSFYIQQRINGIDIFNAISTATIKNNSVVNFANRFHALIENKINVIAPSISPVDAIKSASTILNLDVTKEISLIEESENYFKYKAPSISIEDITAKLVYYPISESSLKLAWDFSILTLDSKNWYSIRVDALDGEIIHINVWLIHCEFDSKY